MVSRVTWLLNGKKKIWENLQQQKKIITDVGFVFFVGKWNKFRHFDIPIGSWKGGWQQLDALLLPQEQSDRRSRHVISVNIKSDYKIHEQISRFLSNQICHRRSQSGFMSKSFQIGIISKKVCDCRIARNQIFTFDINHWGALKNSAHDKFVGLLEKVKKLLQRHRITNLPTVPNRVCHRRRNFVSVWFSWFGLNPNREG